MSIIIKEIIVKTTIEQNGKSKNNDQLLEKVKRAVSKEIEKQLRQKVAKKDR